MSTPALTVGAFTITPTGLTIAGAPTYEEWRAFGDTLQFLNQAIQLAIGDWINYGEAKFGEKYAAAIQETPYTAGTLRNFASVAATFDLSSRDDKLTFAHYSAVMSLRLPDGQPDRIAQTDLLTRAVAEGLSAKAVYKLAHGERERVYHYQDSPVKPFFDPFGERYIVVLELDTLPAGNTFASVWSEI